VNLLGARGGAEEASGAAKAIRIGLDGNALYLAFAFDSPSRRSASS